MLDLSKLLSAINPLEINVGIELYDALQFIRLAMSYTTPNFVWLVNSEQYFSQLAFASDFRVTFTIASVHLIFQNGIGRCFLFDLALFLFFFLQCNVSFANDVNDSTIFLKVSLLLSSIRSSVIKY